MGSVTENPGIFGKLWEDFDAKISISEAGNNEKEREENDTRGNNDTEEEVEEEEEEEFSFACANPDGSPISADDIFQDGQIRPMFPLFNQNLIFSDDLTEKKAALRPPLKKLFVGKSDDSSSSEAEGPYCEWRGKAVEEASPVICKKSNSTGFSKLWRSRDRVVRSSSDGKDAFVFLRHHNPSSASNSGNKNSGKVEKVGAKKGVQKKGRKGETVSSAHEKHYVRNRAMKEGDKRRSYLPYRQDLVGFFANVNGFSRNVHPF